MDMDKLTLILLGIAVLCVIALLIGSALLEPEAQGALISQISQIAPVEVL